jgi:hypothetical protein
MGESRGALLAEGLQARAGTRRYGNHERPEKWSTQNRGAPGASQVPVGAAEGEAPATHPELTRNSPAQGEHRAASPWVASRVSPGQKSPTLA